MNAEAVASFFGGATNTISTQQVRNMSTLPDEIIKEFMIRRWNGILLRSSGLYPSHGRRQRHSMYLIVCLTSVLWVCSVPARVQFIESIKLNVKLIIFEWSGSFDAISSFSITFFARVDPNVVFFLFQFVPDWKSVIFLLLWFFAPQIRFMPIGRAYRFLVCFHIVASNWYTHCLHQPPLISGARRRIESRNTHTFALECRCQKHKLSYQMRNDFCFDCCCWLGPNKAFIHHFTANGIRYLLHSFIICVFRLRSIGIYSIPVGCQFSQLGATDAEQTHSFDFRSCSVFPRKRLQVFSFSPPN